MRVLGIEISSSVAMGVVVVGNRASAQLSQLDTPRIALGASEATQIKNLIAFKNVLLSVIRDAKPDAVAIIRADDSASAIRTKVECMIQLAAHEANLPSHLVAPQTVAAALKRKLDAEATAELASAIRSIEPKYLTKAAVCGWWALDAG